MTSATNDIVWNHQMQVGVAILDEQHRQLLDLINTYGADLALGHGYKRMMIGFREIIDNFKMHFKTEEDLMSGNRFPGFGQHKRIHDLFMERLISYIDKYETGDRFLGLEAHRFLRDWLYNHIMDHTSFADRELGLFLNKNGIY